MGVNTWTGKRQASGKGQRAIVTQRVRVQRGDVDVEHVLTYPKCLDVFTDEEIDDIIDDIVVMAARKLALSSEIGEAQATRRRVAGVLVYDPGFWQRMRVRVGR